MARNAGCRSLALLAALALGVGGAGGRALATTTVSVQVIGGGEVTGGGGQINCGAGSKSCYATYVSGTSVTLTATAPAGWTFSGWDGSDDCSGTSTTCSVPLDGAKHQETAEFTPLAPAGTSTLTVTRPDGGDVAGGKIDCGSAASETNCSWEVATGSTLTLVEDPDSGYTFGGWGGACSGAAKSCTVTMDQDRSVTATFTQSAVTHTLSVTVTGNGTVTGGGIACTSAGGSSCSASEPAGSEVTLTATPGSGAGFTGWGGACAGTSTTCTVTMTAAKSLTAAFSGGSTVPLTVSVRGRGTVTGGAINCGNGATTCSANVATNSSVTLTETPAAGATFKGWGGACTGTAKICTLTMNAAKTVSATFVGEAPATNATLIVHVAGNGVVSAPGGKCPSGGTKTCTQSYTTGTSIGLTAMPQPGARFIGWSGACTGAQTTCTVTLTASKTATATFSGAPAPAARAALLARGRPIVKRAQAGFEVTLRFSTTRRGTAHVRALRAGRVIAAFSFAVDAGPVTIGPFPVSKPGFYTFEVALGARAIHWGACLGRCGAAAHADPFVLTREPAKVVRAGAVWSVTIRFRATLPAGADLRVYRGTKLAWDYRFAPPAGSVSAGPFLLSPGSYTLRLRATDAWGRVQTLIWFAFLPR